MCVGRRRIYASTNRFQHVFSFVDSAFLVFPAAAAAAVAPCGGVCCSGFVPCNYIWAIHFSNLILSPLFMCLNWMFVTMHDALYSAVSVIIRLLGRAWTKKMLCSWTTNRIDLYWAALTKGDNMLSFFVPCSSPWHTMSIYPYLLHFRLIKFPNQEAVLSNIEA